MKVLFYDILWDTDDGETDDLPKEITLDVPKDTDLDAEGADFLSNSHGWCVKGFQYKRI